MSLPVRTGFKTEEFVPLDRWIRAGNTLLVMAALSDSPDWHADFGGYEQGNVPLLTGLEVETTATRSATGAPRARQACPTEERRRSRLSRIGEYREPLRTTIVAEPRARLLRRREGTSSRCRTTRAASGP